MTVGFELPQAMRGSHLAEVGRGARSTESYGVLDAESPTQHGEIEMNKTTIDVEALLDAAEEVLCDRERVVTPAEARLALIVHAARPQSLGKEACPCCTEDEKVECDECLPATEIVAGLRAMAAT